MQTPIGIILRGQAAPDAGDLTAKVASNLGPLPMIIHAAAQQVKYVTCGLSIHMIRTIHTRTQHSSVQSTVNAGRASAEVPPNGS
jgi:hypothetical protein